MATVRVSDEVQAQLDEYICIQRAAIDEATTRSGSNFEALVKDLAELFHRKYQATGDLRYLDESVSTLRVLLDLRPAGHLDRMSSLRNLSVALRISHARAPDADKVEEAAVYLRELLDASPPGDPSRGVCLGHLVPVLYARSQHSQSPSDLEELVAVNQEWVTYCPPGHPVRDDALDSLASALHRSFKQGGHTSLLTESIQAYRQALLLRPPGHVSRDESLTGLGLALLASDARGDPGALDEASTYLQEVLELRPPDHPFRASALSNVASALEAQFQRDGNKAHLARAIALNREALELRPPGHPSRHAALNHLAMVLSSGSDDSETRDEAIRLLRLALDSCPVGTETRFVYMNNLAATLREVYEHRGHVPTLLESMELQREALKLSPPGHPSRDISLAHVAVGLEEMFKAGHHACLEESITLHREALELRPLGHPQRSASLTRLAGVLRLRFEQGRLPGDLTEAVVLYREALLLRPQGHPSRFESLFSLGICLLTVGTPVFDFHGALAHISEGITDDAGPALQRVRKAVECVNELNSRVYANWATVTAGFDLDIRHRIHLQVLNMIYSAAKLIPRIAHFGLDHAARLEVAASFQGVCSTGAALALWLGEPVKVLEMLEEGRGLFWDQALRLRASDLDTIPTEDRRVLEKLFSSLENESNRAFRSSLQMDTLERERDMERRRVLAEQAEALISKIRSYPGHNRFLLSPSLSELATFLPPNGYFVTLVESGPVYVAYIVHGRTGDTESIQLKPPPAGFLSAAVTSSLPRGVDVRSQHLDNMGEDPLTSRQSASPPVEDAEGCNAMPLVELNERGMLVSKRAVRHFEDTLADLWMFIVKPVIDALGLQKSSGRQRPRVWWSVSDLSSLPIHAAGIYDTSDSGISNAHEECASNYIVSSYIPTFSALAKARKAFKPVSRTTLRGLVVHEPAPGKGFRAIPAAVEEARVVGKCFEEADAHLITGPEASPTVSGVLRSLQEGDVHVLHLACHGTQHANPLQSSFILADGDLSIAELMKLKLPTAFLAFLSACETAKGSEAHPDQAVHLAASMLFCGFRSTIGTMWSMNDEDGPAIASSVYQSLLAKDQLDLDDVPYALDDAIQELRRSGSTAARWALFMHMGG